MNKIYMIGNTHFDPVWLWKWDEAMSSITATFKAALDRMDEYADFLYSFVALRFLNGSNRQIRRCLRQSSAVSKKEDGSFTRAGGCSPTAFRRRAKAWFAKDCTAKDT